MSANAPPMRDPRLKRHRRRKVVNLVALWYLRAAIGRVYGATAGEAWGKAAALVLAGFVLTFVSIVGAFESIVLF